MLYYLVMEDFLYPQPASKTMADAKARLAELERLTAHKGKMTVVAAETVEIAERKAAAWWKAQKK